MANKLSSNLKNCPHCGSPSLKLEKDTITETTEGTFSVIVKCADNKCGYMAVEVLA